MPRYDREYRGPLMGPGGEVWRRRTPSRRRRWRAWEDELDRGLRRAPYPGHPAHGEPVRDIHTYDMDYGLRTGGPFEYSGRAGYPEPRWATPPRRRWPPPPYREPPEPPWWPRGVRVPRVTEPRHRTSPEWYDEIYWSRRRHRPRSDAWHWSAAEPPPRRRRPDYG
jgi:hypothetical protein